jgi:hypothetical protein
MAFCGSMSPMLGFALREEDVKDSIGPNTMRESF